MGPAKDAYQPPASRFYPPHLPTRPGSLRHVSRLPASCTAVSGAVDCSGISYDVMMIYLPQHQVVALFNENATVNVTVGPLLDVVDHNLRAPSAEPAIPIVIAIVAVLGVSAHMRYLEDHPPGHTMVTPRRKRNATRGHGRTRRSD